MFGGLVFLWSEYIFRKNDMKSVPYNKYLKQLSKETMYYEGLFYLKIEPFFLHFPITILHAAHSPS